ncbi:MAG TPA: FeoA domain-containing protein [Longimicrobiales bacterium]
MSNPESQVRSLAATGPGESVEIRRILFGTLRALCADLGVREGDVVRCRAGTGSHIWLETPSGRTVAIERDWARFIQVCDPEHHGRMPDLPLIEEAATVQL